MNAGVYVAPKPKTYIVLASLGSVRVCVCARYIDPTETRAMSNLLEFSLSPILFGCLQTIPPSANNGTSVI